MSTSHRRTHGEMDVYRCRESHASAVEGVNFIIPVEEEEEKLVFERGDYGQLQYIPPDLETEVRTFLFLPRTLRAQIHTDFSMGLCAKIRDIVPEG